MGKMLAHDSEYIAILDLFWLRMHLSLLTPWEKLIHYVYTPRISSCKIASSILTRPTSAAQSKNLVVCVYNCDFSESHH